MDDLPLPIRNAVRAVIVRDASLLVQRKEYETGEVRYTLPGGAPEPGETLAEGLRRECLEEIGTTVRIVDLIHIADFFKPRDTEPPTRRQMVEFLFRCEVPSAYEATNGLLPDKHQVSVHWLPFCQMDESPLFPYGLRHILLPEGSGHPVYLGTLS